MGKSDDYQKRAGDHVSGHGRESGRVSPAAKAFRAVTAIVVFGIPLVTGAAAILSYAVRTAYKRIKDDS
jgi:hypothetical protein